MREGAPACPARESDYDGPLMAAPPAGQRDLADWEYGMGKRACEDVLPRPGASAASRHARSASRS